jgi:hypothetical protein
MIKPARGARMDDLIEALEKIKQDVQRMHYEIECLQAEKKMWFCL